MKVFSIKLNTKYVNAKSHIDVIPIGERYYKTSFPNGIAISTDVGTFHYAIDNGFVTNFRSGGKLVDTFIDQIGSIYCQLAYLIHDANYTPCLSLKKEHPLSRKASDELLKAMLVFGGMSKLKSSLVYNSVRLFGGSAYDEDDELTEENSKRFTFFWRDN